jgi:hypothetical protein
MVRDTSLGAGAILVKVDVDGTNTFPGYPIIFDSRIQVLSTVLQGEIGLDAEGEIEILDPEEIALFIGTLSAHSFNFIADNLSPGEHVVTVSVKGLTAAGSQQGSAAAIAAVGLGSMTVEEVRMVQGEEIYFD